MNGPSGQPLSTNEFKRLIVRPSASLVTPVGRGAVATIRVFGPLYALIEPFDQQLTFQAANGQPLLQQPKGKIVFGRWGQSLQPGEDVVVCRLDSQTFEIHCHGGDAAVQRILADLSNAGCDVIHWDQQLSDARDRLEADCQMTLSLASTWRTAEILHEQTMGLLRQAYSDALRLCDAVTFPDEFLGKVDALLEWSEFGMHLSQPWSIVLSGRPNVGKSSLINAILGYERAIVFDQPGTTRDVVTAETALEGWPVVLADTAGVRETEDELESAGIALARQRLRSANLVLVLVDLNQSPTESDRHLFRDWPKASVALPPKRGQTPATGEQLDRDHNGKGSVPVSGANAIVIGHKCDLRDEWGDELPDGAIRVSSVTKQGLDELHQAIVHTLVPSVPPAGTAIPINEHQQELLHSARQAGIRGDRASARSAVAAVFNAPPD